MGLGLRDQNSGVLKRRTDREEKDGGRYLLINKRLGKGTDQIEERFVGTGGLRSLDPGLGTSVYGSLNPVPSPRPPGVLSRCLRLRVEERGFVRAVRE